MMKAVLGTALTLAVLAAGSSGCDFAAAVAEEVILAAVLEPCTQDSDCAPPLFCHSEDKLCVISEDPCIGVTYTGLCDGEIVTWCEDQELHGIDCSLNDQVCGFDAENGVFNCIDSE